MILYAAIFLIVVLIAAFYFSTNRLSQFGTDPSGARLEKIKKSPNYNGEKFVNLSGFEMKMSFDFMKEVFPKFLFGKEERVPAREIDIVVPDPSTTDSTALKATWLGHSTVLLEIDGKKILTDPVWAKRTSPSSITGPARFHKVPLALDQLPPLDAVIISHDHYDHLDRDAIIELAGTGVTFLMPLGIGAHLESWDIDSAQIKEFDWWDEIALGDGTFKIVATPAQHFSGRGFTRRDDATFWASWAIVGPRHRVFFSGDTGEFDELSQIAERFAPFDMTLMKIGAYSKYWPGVHLFPEQSVRVHNLMQAKLLLPIHWGTFNLALHPWYEPPELLMTAAAETNTSIVIPRPGQTIDFEKPAPVRTWWRDYQKQL